MNLATGSSRSKLSLKKRLRYKFSTINKKLNETRCLTSLATGLFRDNFQTFPLFIGDTEPTHTPTRSSKTPDKEKDINTERQNKDNLTELLGSNPDNKTKQSKPLHEEICVRWNIYLKEGLTKEQKKEITDKYPTFENCQLLTPPKLNLEIQDCLNNKALRHDQFMETIQSQIGHSLSAIGVEINKILELEDKESSKQTSNTLAEAGHLLCNIHHAITVSRKYQILPFLNYNTRKLV